MRGLLLALLLALPLLPARALAGPETVATIAPVHSLVARVMQGVGTPHLLVAPGASPHRVALRPSNAAALERAALVFRVGPAIETWLDRPLQTLVAGARVVRLDQVPGLIRLALREGARFEAHAHADHAHADHAHADHAQDEHGRAARGYDGAGDDGAGDDGAIDPHFWLDPANARLWLDAIAAALGEADPANAAHYRANAAAARVELAALEAEIAARLAPLAGVPFVVFHDGYRYFEHRFGLQAAGAVALSDARAPGPARISEVQELIRETGAVCVFREPQFRPGLVATVTEGSGARVGVLDPVGADLAPGPGLYPALIRGLAVGLAECLA